MKINVRFNSLNVNELNSIKGGFGEQVLDGDDSSGSTNNSNSNAGDDVGILLRGVEKDKIN